MKVNKWLRFWYIKFLSMENKIMEKNKTLKEKIGVPILGAATISIPVILLTAPLWPVAVPLVAFAAYAGLGLCAAVAKTGKGQLYGYRESGGGGEPDEG